MLRKLLSIPKSLWINVKYLPLRQAVRLPICVSYDTTIIIKGRIVISANNISPAMIRIGFHFVPVCEKKSLTSIVVARHAMLEFRGHAHIGNGTKLHIADSAQLSLGDNFSISASSAINCYKCIRFGRDIQFSWNCLVMDSDTHMIFDREGNVINENKNVVFGDKIWIGCNTTILKGSIIPSNCVIGANSLVSGDQFEEKTIIVGNPAKSIKKIGGWQL